MQTTSPQTKPAEGTQSVKCDQCEAMMINGTFCHEVGCPNSRKTWLANEGEWVKFLECFECGCDVREGDACDCQEIQD